MLTPNQFLSNEDIEEFANFLGFNGIDSDMYYESYYQLNTDDRYVEEEYEDELNQTRWEY